MSQTTTLIDRPVRAIRQTRRAYFGALGLGYDFAVARADKRMGQARELFTDLVARGETIETEARTLMTRAKREAREAFRLQSDDALTIVSDEAPAKAAAVAAEPKGVALDDMSDALQKQVRAVQKYDSQANPAVVAKIVTHLGVALQSRDGRYVACSDEAERKTVATRWLSKTLGVSGTAEQLDAKVGAVCTLMKADRMKDRVTFYYLLAKNEGALGKI